MKLFSNAEGRIIVATFASNIHRIQQIIDAAESYGRKVAVSGRIFEIRQVAKELGYLESKEDTLISFNRF